MRPMLVGEADEVAPGIDQMLRVVEQLMATKIGREEPLAIGDRLIGGHTVESGGAPDLFGRLDNEGAGLVVEGVGMGLEPAVLGLLKGEGERGETLMRA